MLNVKHNNIMYPHWYIGIARMLLSVQNFRDTSLGQTDTFAVWMVLNPYNKTGEPLPPVSY